jgi:hypothetical protein
MFVRPTSPRVSFITSRVPMIDNEPASILFTLSSATSQGPYSCQASQRDASAMDRETKAPCRRRTSLVTRTPHCQITLEAHDTPPDLGLPSSLYSMSTTRTFRNVGRAMDGEIDMCYERSDLQVETCKPRRTFMTQFNSDRAAEGTANQRCKVATHGRSPKCHRRQ